MVKSAKCLPTQTWERKKKKTVDVKNRKWLLFSVLFLPPWMRVHYFLESPEDTKMKLFFSFFLSENYFSSSLFLMVVEGMAARLRTCRGDQMRSRRRENSRMYFHAITLVKEQKCKWGPIKRRATSTTFEMRECVKKQRWKESLIGLHGVRMFLTSSVMNLSVSIQGSLFDIWPMSHPF